MSKRPALLRALPLALLLALPAPALAAGTTVTVKGSDTMVILVQRWAEAFMKRNSGVRLQVTGGGSGTGIAALINGTTEVAAASRPMKEAERKALRTRHGGAEHEVAVARDGVTFYVHAKNPLSSLTAEQLRGIYLGDITNWRQVGGPDQRIVVYSRENSSGTYVFVKDELLGGGDFTPSAQTLPGTAAVVNAVAREPWGIGYGGAAYAAGIKALKVRVGSTEVEPTLEAVKAGRYPLSRNLFFYIRGTPSPGAKAFIDFCLSPEGQQVVSKVGYFPVR